MTETLGLGPESLVVEIASNDGYLLQYFVERGIPVLGIEPAANVAEVAEAAGHSDAGTSSSAPSCARGLADGASQRDLIVANNVLAHVPDLNDFVEGLRRPADAARASSPSSFRTCSA